MCVVYIYYFFISSPKRLVYCCWLDTISQFGLRVSPKLFKPLMKDNMVHFTSLDEDILHLVLTQVKTHSHLLKYIETY